MPPIFFRPRAGSLAALALALAAGPTVAQTTYTFTDQAAEPRPWFINGLTPGFSPDFNWPNGTGAPNAPPNTEPLPNNPNTVLVFPGSNPYTANNNLDPSLGNFQLNQLNLTANGTPAPNPIQISGGPLQFINSTTATAPQITKSGNGTYSVDNNLVLTNNLTSSGSGGALNFGEPTLGGSTVSVISGPGSITVTNSNNVIFYGLNTYTGGTTLNGTGTLIVGNNNALGTGPLTFAGGAVNRTMRLAGNITGLGAVTLPNNVSLGSNLTFGSGSVSTSSLSFSGNWDLANGARTITNNTNSSGGSTTVTIGGAISNGTGAGAGSLIKAGASPLALTGTNTYTGTTNVSAGSLVLSGSGSIANSPTVTINSGATLDVSGVTGGANFNNGSFALAAGQTIAGNGNVIGNFGVRNGSTVSPTGATGPIGTLNVAGNTALDGVLLADVFNATADRLAVTGSLALSGTSVLTLPLTNVYDNTTPLQLATYATESGQFGTVNNKPANYDLFYGTFSGFPNAIVLAPTAVPEPGTLALAGLAAAGLWRWRRRA